MAQAEEGLPLLRVHGRGYEQLHRYALDAPRPNAYNLKPGRAAVTRLESAHADYAAIEVSEGHELVVWGVVTTLVHRFR